MIILNKLRAKVGGEDKEFLCGIPNNDTEMDKMFQIRYDVYAKHNYIDENLYPSGREKDELDDSGKCEYFIVSVDDEVVGSVRLIKGDTLPTQDYFIFKEPDEIKNIPTNRRGELGRLVAKSYQNNGEYLPRHMILLFLIKSLVDYGVSNNIDGGYSFIKSKLKNKFLALKLPINIIEYSDFKCSEDDVLYKYFHDPEDPVIPMSFLVRDIKRYIDKFLKSIVFKKEGEIYILRIKLYRLIIRLIKLI